MEANNIYNNTNWPTAKYSTLLHATWSFSLDNNSLLRGKSSKRVWNNIGGERTENDCERFPKIGTENRGLKKMNGFHLYFNETQISLTSLFHFTITLFAKHENRNLLFLQ
jgi:hypothetical protein